MGADKKIGISELVLEITRKCNMSCKHCLRGAAQDLDMDTIVIDKLLENISYIGSVCFTGGEPSLNPGVIRYFLDRCKALKIEIYSFYVVTNGSFYSQEFIDILIDVYAYSSDKESNALLISIDKYHDNIPEEVIRKYEALSFYKHKKNCIMSLMRVALFGMA